LRIREAQKHADPDPQPSCFPEFIMFVSTRKCRGLLFIIYGNNILRIEKRIAVVPFVYEQAVFVHLCG
jgi:hypothetical protein